MQVTRTYKVNMPDYDDAPGSTWQRLVAEFLKDAEPEYPSCSEDMELDVLRGNIAYWLTIMFDAGNFSAVASVLVRCTTSPFSGLVQFEDYHIED